MSESIEQKKFHFVIGVGMGDEFKSIDLTNNFPVNVWLTIDGHKAQMTMPVDLFASAILEIIKTPQKQH
jgi:hypothetical protein